MKYSNLHTHCVFCDGKNTPEDMIARAEELGFVSLGFSSHASQTMNSFWGLRNELGYIEKIRALAAENDRIRIHLGVELDTVAHCEREKYDYILVKRAVMGTITLSDTQKAAADVNKKDGVEKYDYILIKRHVMGTFTIAG